MSKKPRWHANERVDKPDLEQISEHAEGVVEEEKKNNLLDNRSLVLNGFRVEVPSQTLYPGRIVIHGGSAYDYDGQLLFNEDQLNNSRTITLEGLSNVFWVEIEVVEVDSDLDSRAHWDPTVDQGTDFSGDDLPDGQEGNVTVATRKTHDWRVVQPIRVGAGIGFERDNPGTLDSLKVPVVRLETDGANEITDVVNPNIAFESPRTTLVEEISLSQHKVIDSRLFIVGDIINLGKGSANAELVTILTINYETHLITTTSATLAHLPGDIIIEEGVTPREIIGNALFGSYQRPYEANINDYKDRAYAGDERHGEILMRGHDDTDLPVRSDTNLQTLKDQIDFLSAQIQEMKFGHPDPTLSKISTERIPAGLVNSFPTIPRYFDDAGSIQGARTATVTVGDGVKSWGDFTAADETGINAAFAALSTIGGTIVIKSGTYTLANDVVPSTSSYITVVGEGSTNIITSVGARFRLDGGGAYPLIIRGLRFQGDTLTVDGVYIDNSLEVTIEDCIFYNAQVDINAQTSEDLRFIRCDFYTNDAVFDTEPLILSSITGDLRGTFESCGFMRTTAPAALVGSCIESGSNGQVNDLNVFNCNFEDAGTPASLVFIAGSNTTFRECRFTCSNPTACIDIDATTGINSLLILETSFVTTGGSYLIARNSTEVSVKSIKNSWSTTANNLKFINCDDVIIKDNLLGKRIGGGYTSLTEACVYIEGTTVGAAKNKNYTITNNSFYSDADDATGIIFDVKGTNSLFTSVNIANNVFDQLECGIHFKATSTGGILYGLNVNNNTFKDEGVSYAVALYQKVGIFAQQKISAYNSVISNNTFTNLNPVTSNTVDAAEANRVGIVFSSSNLYRLNILGNIISKVGVATNYVDFTAGILLGETESCIIDSNNISYIVGESAEGINLTSVAGGSSVNSIVSNNIIESILSNAGDSYGITAKNCHSTSIRGNNLKTMTSVAGYEVGIGSIGASYLWTRSSIIGNYAYDISSGSFINLSCDYVTDITINSNTVYSGVYTGILISTAAGTTSRNVVISSNNLYLIEYVGISVTTLTTGVCYYANISNNIVNMHTTADWAMLFSYITSLNVSGNTMSTSKTTASTLYAANCERIVIDNNYIEDDGATNTVGVKLDTGCDIFLINNNLFYSAGANSKSIVTSGAGAIADAIIAHNLFTNDGTFGANNYGNAGVHALLSGAGQFGVQY